jgi:hypothetical protein
MASEVDVVHMKASTAGVIGMPVVEKPAMSSQHLKTS